LALSNKVTAICWEVSNANRYRTRKTKRKKKERKKEQKEAMKRFCMGRFQLPLLFLFSEHHLQHLSSLCHVLGEEGVGVETALNGRETPPEEDMAPEGIVVGAEVGERGLVRTSEEGEGGVLGESL
jgi:hypothetical protein